MLKPGADLLILPGNSIAGFVCAAPLGSCGLTEVAGLSAKPMSCQARRSPLAIAVNPEAVRMPMTVMDRMRSCSEAVLCGAGPLPADSFGLGKNQTKRSS